MLSRKGYCAFAAFVVLCLGSFVIFKPKAPLEPIKIYKATPAPKPKPSQPKRTAAERATPANPPHAHPHETSPHSHAAESASSGGEYDWRVDNRGDVPSSEEDPWQQTDAPPAVHADVQTYPPRDWHKTEDPELYAEYFRAVLIKKFGDIPPVHIVVEDARKMMLRIPQTHDEFIATLEATYQLWPNEANRRALEHNRKLKAEGAQVNIIYGGNPK